MALIDCDIHAVLPGIDALLPYLPEYWREQISQTGFKGPIDRWHAPSLATAVRSGVSTGLSAASSLAQIQADVLDGSAKPEFAILHSDCAIESLHNPKAAEAFSEAINRWLADHWLAKEPRLRASIAVCPQFPGLAAQEIDRRAGTPGFVQVVLPVRSEAPYGSHNYRPIFAAAARNNLPVALHYGGAPGSPSTPVGWPSLHWEDYAGMTGVFQTQLISLVTGGVFDEFPRLKVVLVEGGFSWLPATLWRLDKNWKGLRREIPWVRRAPSEYIREHVRLTTSPSDAPTSGDRLRTLIEDCGGPEVLLYSSDYPHHHGADSFDNHWKALPASFQAKIGHENARTLYRL